MASSKISEVRFGAEKMKYRRHDCLPDPSTLPRRWLSLSTIRLRRHDFRKLVTSVTM